MDDQLALDKMPPGDFVRKQVQSSPVNPGSFTDISSPVNMLMLGVKLMKISFPVGKMCIPIPPKTSVYICTLVKSLTQFVTLAQFVKLVVLLSVRTREKFAWIAMMTACPAGISAITFNKSIELETGGIELETGGIGGGNVTLVQFRTCSVTVVPLMVTLMVVLEQIT